MKINKIIWLIYSKLSQQKIINKTKKHITSDVKWWCIKEQEFNKLNTLLWIYKNGAKKTDTD